MTSLIDETHDPALASWVISAHGHLDFPIQNLPFGVFSSPDDGARGGMAIGDCILDLKALASSGQLDGETQSAAHAASGAVLNPLLALGPAPRLALRRAVSALLTNDKHRAAIEPMLYDASRATMHLPAAIGDYTDFYAGIHHAMNVGRQFRPDNPLLPNYKHVPIGYHGRASSVRVSGHGLHRPNGQRKAPDREAPDFGPTRRLDYETEIGIWIGPGNELGRPIPIGQAQTHAAGLCLLNDWSARDIQAWEYQPLGPFLAKSFLTSVSAWIVTAEALAPFRIAQPARPDGDPQPLPYLDNAGDHATGAYAIALETSIVTTRMRDQGLPPHRLSCTAASHMYWTVAQMIAHHTSNGCNLNPGDLLGTGTISAPTDDGWGSLIEISRGGKEPIILPTGETRTFLEDSDEIIMTGRTHAAGFISIGFGRCRSIIQPMLEV